MSQTKCPNCGSYDTVSTDAAGDGTCDCCITIFIYFPLVAVGFILLIGDIGWHTLGGLACFAACAGIFYLKTKICVPSGDMQCNLCKYKFR